MRALLIVNPHATSTTRGRRDVIVRALASAVDLEVVETRYRGDATRLAATAASDKFGLVMTLGGDGTVNEAVNGLLGGADNPGASAAGRTGASTGRGISLRGGDRPVDPTAADLTAPDDAALDEAALAAAHDAALDDAALDQRGAGRAPATKRR